MTDTDKEYVIVGKVTGPHGVRGSLKVWSWTEHPANILDYSPWFLRQADQSEESWRKFEPSDGKAHGKGIVVNLKTVNDRNQAELFNGYEIAVLRDQIPAPEKGEYYWLDLIGLRVFNQDGIDMGLVDSLLETGANDVLVVKQGDRERLIPFVMDVHVTGIDLDKKVMQVDWDPEF